MYQENTNGEPKPAEGAWTEFQSCCGQGADRFGSRGEGMREMMRSCPCGEVLRKHRLAVYTTLVVVGLALLALPVGWVLGVIAFFRTI